MATLTTATAGLAPTVAPAYKQYYERVTLENARVNLVHQQFGRKYPLPKGIGKQIEWRRASTLNTVSATPLTEGVVPTENTFAYTAVTVTFNQYGDYIKGSDILQLTAYDAILDDIAEEQGDQAGRTLEEVTRDALVLGTTVQRAAGRASRVTIASTDKINSNELVLARRTLLTNLAKPFDGRYFGAVISTFTEADLLRDTDIVSVLKAGNTGGEALLQGEVGRYMSFKFVVSTMAKVFTGAGAAGIDVHATLCFGKNAFGITALEGAGLQTIFQPVGSAGAADPLKQYWTKGWKVTHAVKILNDAFMLRIEHAVGA